MAAYLRPRRGTSSNNNIVLKEGELYLDTSNSNNTSNSWGRIYIGDNSTTISNLKPFIDYPENMIIHSGISSTGSESSISNGNTLSTIISAIKNVLSTKSSVIKISETDYSNLSASEKNDPNKVYFRYEASSIWQNYLLLSGGTMTGALTSPGINMTGNINFTSNGNIITPGNDNYGVIPNSTNYGQIGSSTYYYYRMYSASYNIRYGSYTGELSVSSLSADRNWLFPDASGSVAIVYKSAGTASAGTGWRDSTAKIYNLSKGYYFIQAWGVFANTNQLEGVRIAANNSVYQQNVINMTYSQSININTCGLFEFTNDFNATCQVYTGASNSVTCGIIAIRVS